MVIVYSLNFDCKYAEQAMNRLNMIGYKTHSITIQERSIGVLPNFLLRLAIIK